MATKVETSVAITINRDALARAMEHLARVVERRNTIPILGNVRLSPGDRYITLTATDLDIDVQIDVDCEVSGDGAITVPARTLHDVARKLPDGVAVTLNWGADASSVAVRAGRSRFTLQALPVDDFPDLAAGDMPHRFTMAAATLLDMIESTSFAISTEETRYYLNGIYLHCVEPRADEQSPEQAATLRAVATDGRRLARFDAPAPEGASGMPGIIVPRKTVGEIARLAKEAMDREGRGKVEIALSAAKIRVSTTHVTLTSKLIDGTFPDYQRVIPHGNDKRATLAREAFARAADRVATISSERGRAVKLSFDEGKLRLSVTNPDAGSAEEEIEAEYTEAAIDVGFNSRYLADTLAAIEGDTVLVKLGDAGSPALFQKSEADNLLIVLMPMRVS